MKYVTMFLIYIVILVLPPVIKDDVYRAVYVKIAIVECLLGFLWYIFR